MNWKLCHGTQKNPWEITLFSIARDLYLKISYSGYVDNKLNHEPHLKNLHIQSSQVATNIFYLKKGELETVGFLRGLQNKRYKVTL